MLSSSFLHHLLTQNQEKTQPGHQHQNRNNNQTNTQNQNQNQNRRRNNAKPEGPKREAILDLNKYKDQKIRVKFMGGRQITGVLTGFDQLMNLVLEDVEEKVSGTYFEGRPEQVDKLLTKRPKSARRPPDRSSVSWSEVHLCSHWDHLTAARRLTILFCRNKCTLGAEGGYFKST